MTVDFPFHGLVRGQVGTIVEVPAPKVYEVEFGDDEGRTLGLAAPCTEQLVRPHHEPVLLIA
ncbi:MAG: DUF4926 domain-containing protein [Acidobacteriaceae bacterium]|nr:DUF4926 domain-containing protein [Acidobacteriaceae bacterium]